MTRSKADFRIIAGVALITACMAGAFALSHLADANGARPRIGAVTIEHTGKEVQIASRSDREATMHVVVSGGGDDLYKAVTPGAGQGGRVSFTGLAPHTVYTYKVWFESDKNGYLYDSPVATSSFTVDATAPIITANSQ